MVTDQQLLQVAANIGKAWRRIAIFLGISQVQLEQIEENRPRDHVDKVFEMLSLWKKLQGKKATAAHLHAKLTELDEDVPDDIDFLLEDPVSFVPNSPIHVTAGNKKYPKHSNYYYPY